MTTEARWRGVSLEDMTREELIEAMHELSAWHERTVEMLTTKVMLK